MTPQSYTLTTPYGRRTGRGTIRTEREAQELARVHVQLGEAHLELVLSGANLANLIEQLRRVQLSTAELEQLDDRLEGVA